MNWQGLVFVVAGGLMIYFLWRSIKSSPERFQAKNLLKASQTLLIVAVALIAFITVCILLLRM